LFFFTRIRPRPLAPLGLFFSKQRDALGIVSERGADHHTAVCVGSERLTRALKCRALFLKCSFIECYIGYYHRAGGGSAWSRRIRALRAQQRLIQNCLGGIVHEHNVAMLLSIIVVIIDVSVQGECRGLSSSSDCAGTNNRWGSIHHVAVDALHDDRLLM
jgi:hypothetical protein